MAPTLTGKEAEKFLKNMIKKENSPITKKEKKIAEEIRNNFPNENLRKRMYEIGFNEALDYIYEDEFLDELYNTTPCNCCKKWRKSVVEFKQRIKKMEKN